MWFDLALIALGGFLAALVIGSAGFFAFAIVVTGIWIYVLPPVQIVLLASICATLLQGASVWRSRQAIETQLLWPFVFVGVSGERFPDQIEPHYQERDSDQPVKQLLIDSGPNTDAKPDASQRWNRGEKRKHRTGSGQDAVVNQ